MPELEPITREEKFLNGEVGMTPITREEKILAGEDIETVTRREYFLKKYRGGGGGDVTVVPLSVTENGTYSEEGKAYSPVSVDVPLPQNAYLLKSVANLPQAIASFNDGEDMVMPSLKVAIEPQQEGSGDPSPTNIRPISGWDEVDLSVSGVNVWDEEWEQGYYNASGLPVSSTTAIRSKNYIPCKPNTSYYFANESGVDGGRICFFDENKEFISTVTGSNKVIVTPSNCAFMVLSTPTQYGGTYNNDISINYPSTDTEYHAYNGQTYTIDLDGTRYGGTLDVVNGVLTVDRASVDLGTLTYTKSPSGLFQTNEIASTVKKSSYSYGPTGYIKSSHFYEIDSASITGPQGSTPSPDGVMAVNSVGLLYINYLAVTDVTDFTTAMNGIQLVYELATPITIQLTPTAIKSLRGVNNVYANTGDIKDAEYFSKEV